MVKGKKPILHRKLVRDMQQNFMQFLAMMLLCALGKPISPDRIFQESGISGA